VVQHTTYPVARTWQRTKTICYFIRTLTNMSCSHSFYSNMQVWWYSFWIRFETYFTNIVLRNYKSKLRSCLEYYFFFKVLTALYCDADGEYVGWKRTDTSTGDAALRIFGSSASKRYQNFGSSLHFSHLSLFTVFVLSVAKFAYHYEGPPHPLPNMPHLAA